MANFRNKLSVDAYEQKHNAELSIRPHKTKAGIFLFCHSDEPEAPAEGLVSEAAKKHLDGGGSWDNLMVADCDYLDANDRPQTCRMLMMAAGNNASSEVLYSRHKAKEASAQ